MAILFGVLAIIGGITLPWMLGYVGFAVVGVFAVLAVCFTILKNKKSETKKKAGIICGVIGLVLGLLMQMGVSGIANKMKADMDKYKDQFPAVAKSVDKFESLGFIGMASALADSGYTADELQKQFNDYMKILNDELSSSDK